jgi:hypothetical protein
MQILRRPWRSIDIGRDVPQRYLNVGPRISSVMTSAIESLSAELFHVVLRRKPALGMPDSGRITAELADRTLRLGDQARPSRRVRE